MSKETVVVFTAKSVERIVREGGTKAWRLDRKHARQCEFAVCTRNTKAKWAEGSEEHHSAFLVGRIRDVVPCTPTPENDEARENRYMIQFSEFARVTVADVWKGDRNPIKYVGLEDLNIDFSTLKWEAMPKATNATAPADQTAAVTNLAVRPLTMTEAKKGLALTFGVAPEAIEITIRG